MEYDAFVLASLAASVWGVPITIQGLRSEKSVILKTVRRRDGANAYLAELVLKQEHLVTLMIMGVFMTHVDCFFHLRIRLAIWNYNG